MELISLFQVFFSFMVILECITGQSTPLICSSVDSSCRLDATNIDSDNVQIKLTIRTPTSNSWYAIGFNNARKMVGTSTIMIEYTNGNYNVYTGYISGYSAPTKDTKTYLTNLATVTSGSSVTISFDAPSKITHNNNQVLDLTTCYLITIGTGMISGTSPSMHSSTPVFSSTCYKLSVPAASTQAQSTAGVTTVNAVTTANNGTAAVTATISNVPTTISDSTTKITTNSTTKSSKTKTTRKSRKHSSEEKGKNNSNSKEH